MIVREVTDADLPRVRELTDAEGWGYEDADLRRLLALCGAGFLALADDTGSIGGTLTVLPYSNAAWIGNVVVDGAWRGHGAGRLLMDAAHHLCDARQMAHVYLDAFPPAIGFYRTLGYHDDGETHRWSRTPAHGPAPVATAVATAVATPVTTAVTTPVVPLGAGDLDAVTAADAAMLDSTGATHRRHLLAHLMRDYPGWALGLRDARGGLAAWAFARPGTTTSELGPIGGAPASAASLADTLLSRLAGRRVELSAPAANLHAERWLRSHDFDPIGWHLRMYRGQRLPWDRQRTWALGGLEKG